MHVSFRCDARVFSFFSGLLKFENKRRNEHTHDEQSRVVHQHVLHLLGSETEFDRQQVPDALKIKYVFKTTKKCISYVKHRQITRVSYTQKIQNQKQFGRIVSVKDTHEFQVSTY